MFGAMGGFAIRYFVGLKGTRRSVRTLLLIYVSVVSVCSGLITLLVWIEGINVISKVHEWIGIALMILAFFVSLYWKKGSIETTVER